jgi:hypothetical protein
MGKPGLILCALLAVGATAWGQDKENGKDKDSASCVVRAIQGIPAARTKDAKAKNEIDGQLAFLQHQLQQPPLSSFGFKLLARHDVVIKRSAPASFPVPGDHAGVLSYQGWTEGPKRRVRVRLTLKDGSARLLDTNYLIDNGGTILHGGIKHGEGILFLAITCRLPD